MALDPETGLILSLTKADRGQALAYFERPVSPKTLVKRRREYAFVMDYMRRFGTFPTASVLKERFPSFKIVIPAHPLGHYVKEIRDRHTYARIVSTVNGDLAEKLSSPDFSGMDEARSLLHQLVLELQEEVSDSRDVRWSKTADSRFSRYRHAERSRGMLGIPTGWPTLDDFMCGLQKGHVITLTGTAWKGKSWCLCVLAHRAFSAGNRVLFVTREMPTVEIARRMDALKFNLPYQQFRTGKLTPGQRFLYRKGLRELSSNGHRGEMIIVGDDEFGHSATPLAIQAKALLYGADLIVVDGAHLLDDDRRTKGKVEKLYNVSRDNKRVANILHRPWLQSVQQGEEDSLEKMTWSRAWANDSDDVIEVLGDRNSKFRTLKVQKQREGRGGEILIHFDLDEMNFAESTLEEVPEEQDSEDKED